MANLDLHEEKKILRKKHLALRNETDAAKRQEMSDKICKTVASLDIFTASSCILLYNSYGSEVVTSALMTESIKHGKSVFYPKVCGEDMEFFEISRPEQLQIGYKGIIEPIGNTPLWDGKDDSLIIVPGAVFGENKHRIGYGKGFYDRFLRKYPRLFSIGISFSSQIEKNLAAEPFDIPLKMVITEKERYE